MSEPEHNAEAGPPPTADIQDPLPESTFFYRRVFSYVLSVAFVALLAFVIWRMDTASELRQVALYLSLLLWFTITYYMVAPSAEQIVKMLQTAKMFISGVRLNTSATAENDQGRASTETTVGRYREPDGSDFRDEEIDAAPRGRT